MIDSIWFAEGCLVLGLARGSIRYIDVPLYRPRRSINASVSGFNVGKSPVQMCDKRSLTNGYRC